MAGLGDAELGPDLLLDSHTEKLLRKDARDAVRDLVASSGAGLTAVRFLIETYYDHQHNRMEAANRRRATLTVGAPGALMGWLEARAEDTELAIKTLLTHYTDIEPTGMGRWARGVTGIGPIISAGLLAYIDITIATNPSKVWRFFGLDPTLKWLPGQKRPWNARAKVLAWKIGDSFCKVHNRPDALYGHLYAERKALETQRNESGAFAEQARRTLEERKIRDKPTCACYESGRLPLGRIELRARRWAVKIFLVHWWQEAWRRKYGTEPPRAYPISILGHADEIHAAS